MRDNNDLINMYLDCSTELRKLGYECAGNITISFERFSKKNLHGLTQRNLLSDGSYAYKISFSTIYQDERVPDKAFRSTMFHELLHTVDGFWDYGHTGPWLAAAKQVKERFPESDPCLVEFEEMGIPEQVFLDVYYKGHPKYVIRCTQCGQKIYRSRMTSFLKHPENSRCGKCGGRFGKVENFERQQESPL